MATNEEPRRLIVTPLGRALFRSVDYKGRVFDRFYVSKDPLHGPGWYVFGRNPDYNDRLVALVAQPAIKPRGHPNYNIRVQRGWSTRREALAYANWFNANTSPTTIIGMTTN
jgi:hypothetical protein